MLERVDIPGPRTEDSQRSGLVRQFTMCVAAPRLKLGSRFCVGDFGSMYVHMSSVVMPLSNVEHTLSTRVVFNTDPELLENHCDEVRSAAAFIQHAYPERSFIYQRKKNFEECYRDGW